MRDFGRRALRSSSLHIMVGLAIGQGTILLATPVLTRTYTPAAMGFAGTFLACASIVGTVATLRLELLIPTATDAEVRWLTKRVIFSLVCFGLISVFGFVAFLPSQAINALLFGCAVVGLGGTALSLQLATRYRVLTGVAASKAGQGLGQAGSQVLAGVFGATHIGMQLGIGIGYAVSATIQTISVRYRAKVPRDRIALTSSRTRRYRRQIAVLTFAALLNIVTVWMYPLLTQLFFGAVATGQLTVSQRLAIVPAGIAVAALLPVIVGEAGLRLRNGEGLRSLVLRWLQRLAPLGIFVTVCLLLVPKNWVVYALGVEWGSVSEYLSAMALMVGSQIIVGPLSQLLVLQGRSREQLVWDATRLIVLLSVSCAAASLSGSPIAMLWSASAVNVLFYAAYIMLVLRQADPISANEGA